MKQFLAVQQQLYGLKCDAPGCNWSDMTIDPGDYHAWVDCPCPKCGANLLTKANFTSVKVIRAAVFLINVAFFPVMVGMWLLGIKAERSTMRVDSRPDGRMIVQPPVPVEEP